MNTLGKRHDQSNRTLENKKIVPAVFLSDENEIPLSRALIMATLIHPLIVLIIWLILFILTNLGIDLSLFQKPEPKVRDIEFVLVNKPEQMPINKNTKNRSDRNSRAGGKNDPTKVVSDPEPSSAKSVPQKAMPELAPQQQTKTVQKSPAQKQVQKSPMKQQSTQKQAQADTPVPPRPAPMKSYAMPKPKKFNAFSIPVPAGKAPKTMMPRGGPVTSGPIGADSGSSSPGPLMSNNGFSGSSRARSASGSSSGGGNAGNPSPGNPNGRPGIDAIREPDFGPYMRELQRRIKRNWEPPKGNESKRVVLDFRVSKDGRLLSLGVHKSSGVAEADRAALSAVELSAPFRPLPPEFRGNDVSIQFTFDYTVNSFSIDARRRY